MRAASSAITETTSRSTAGVCRDLGRILPGNWCFARLVRSLWPVKAAAALEQFTGASDRTCRAWCAGTSEPPAWVLAAIIASDDGERALKLIAGEYGPRWYRKAQRAQAIGEGVSALLSSLPD